MRHRFFVHITGTVQSDSDTAKLEDQTNLEEMTEAVKASFKPDEQWGVQTDEVTVHVFSKEIE